jgi:hypothetical protein
MDPNEALRRAREADSDAERLEAYCALDAWITNDGFLPAVWEKSRRSLKIALSQCLHCEAYFLPRDIVDHVNRCPARKRNQ